jgi:vancomycin permeability regulator SanA
VSRWRWRRLPRRLRLVGLVVLAGVAATVGSASATNVAMVRAADGLAWDDPATVPTRSVAIVFGAFADPVTGPSPALQDRLNSAVALYRAGRVRHLIMTGDNSRPDYDEVTAMRNWALAAGVPGTAITRDYAGLDTYDSCLRARTVFGVTDAVLVTQDFHLARALWLCRRQGIDAVGLDVPDFSHHPERAVAVYDKGQPQTYPVREWFARFNAAVDFEIRHRGPAVPGPFVGLVET